MAASNAECQEQRQQQQQEANQYCNSANPKLEALLYQAVDNVHEQQCNPFTYGGILSMVSPNSLLGMRLKFSTWANASSIAL